MTRPLKLARLYSHLEDGEKVSKRCVNMWLSNSSREPDGLQAASALAATWWKPNRENSEEELNRAKDLRFAGRLRGV